MMRETRNTTRNIQTTLGNAHCGSRDATETQNGRNNSDNKKYQ